MRTPIYLSKISHSQATPPPPVYQFLENIQPRTFSFHTPSLLNLGKCFSQDILTVTKNSFNIFSKIFCHRLSFVRISEVITFRSF